MDTKGIAKASLLSLITAAPKTAMAICGANPAALKTEPIMISNPNATKADLLYLIEHCLEATKIKEESELPDVFIHAGTVALNNSVSSKAFRTKPVPALTKMLCPLFI
jgi:hypothetical protein